MPVTLSRKLATAESLAIPPLQRKVADAVWQGSVCEGKQSLKGKNVAGYWDVLGLLGD